MKKLLLFILLACSILPAVADVPQLTRFYPDSSEKIQECPPSNKIYVYFTTGSKIVSATAQLTQDDEVLGTVVFRGGTPLSNTATMKPSDENAAMNKVKAGNYTLVVYAVEYMEDGETKSYSDLENPLATTTYHFMGANGKVVSERGLEDSTLVSYYQPGGAEGIKTYTFSKPIDPARLYAELEYGYGEMPYITPVPWSLSEDAMTLTLDFRGMSLNSKDLAYGNIFYDLEGNPTDPPTEVTLNIANVVCTDGTKIEYVVASPYTGKTTTLVGRLFASYHLVDMSFETPVLQSVVFYNAENPDEKTASITEGSNMMLLTLSNADVLAKTDVTLTSGEVNAVIAWENITLVDSLLTAPLPAEIVAEGSDKLVIALTAYEFKQEDGATHIIKPLDLSLQAKEIASIAALKESPVGETVILNVRGGVKVTLSNEQGYCFIEDENDGLMVVTPDYSKVLMEGTLLTGKLVGAYQGSGMFMIYPEQCDYTEVQANTRVGIVQPDLDLLATGQYNNRLLTFVATSKLTITTDGENIFIGDVLPVITAFVEDLEMPETITDVTGVLFADENMGQTYLLLRSADDINQDVAYEDPDAITLPHVDLRQTSTIYTLSGMKVALRPGQDKQNLPRGIYIRNGRKFIVK